MWRFYQSLRLVFCCFVFFMQKTAYEMRIRDWSSDVCSSDLPVAAGFVVEGAVGDQQRGRGIAERQLRLERLAALEIAGFVAEELQIDFELAVLHLRIDFGDARRIALAAPIDGRLLPDRDPPEIEFVDARDQLVAARRIDLPDAFALLERQELRSEEHTSELQSLMR